MIARSQATTAALLFTTLLLVAAACGSHPTTAPDTGAPPVVTLVTSMGTIGLELDKALAPSGTANFLSHVDQQFYDGTIFHRVIADSMIQGWFSDVPETPVAVATARRKQPASTG